jgi:hypothetical protein
MIPFISIVHFIKLLHLGVLNNIAFSCASNFLNGFGPCQTGAERVALSIRLHTPVALLQVLHCALSHALPCLNRTSMPFYSNMETYDR